LNSKVIAVGELRGKYEGLTGRTGLNGKGCQLVNHVYLALVRPGYHSLYIQLDTPLLEPQSSLTFATDKGALLKMTRVLYLLSFSFYPRFWSIIKKALIFGEYLNFPCVGLHHNDTKGVVS
jgi:hypothetical protein